MSIDLFPGRQRPLTSEEILELVHADAPYDLDSDELAEALRDHGIDPEFPELRTYSHPTLPGQWLKTPQIAEALARSPETIRNWEKKGILPPSEFSVGSDHGLRPWYSRHQTRWVALVARDAELIDVAADGTVVMRQPDAAKLQSFSVGVHQGWRCPDRADPTAPARPPWSRAGSRNALASLDNPIHDLFNGIPVGPRLAIASWGGPNRAAAFDPYGNKRRR